MFNSCKSSTNAVYAQCIVQGMHWSSGNTPSLFTGRRHKRLGINFKIKKDRIDGSFFSGGPERIRTAVGAFAELCLTTRPQDLFIFFTGLRK